jgi:hypothetical protein
MKGNNTPPNTNTPSALSSRRSSVFVVSPGTTVSVRQHRSDSLEKKDFSTAQNFLQ